jgi:hypothetical protein
MRPRRGLRLAFWLPLLVLLAACASAATPTGPMPTATGGDVRLSADKASYTTRSPIGLTLTNTGHDDYYAIDGRSGCTLVQLQRYDTDKRQWISVDGCAPAGQTHVLLIPAGVREPFTLAPGSSSDSNAWETGLYRVAAAYTTNSDGVSGEHITYSAGFMIHE